MSEVISRRRLFGWLAAAAIAVTAIATGRTAHGSANAAPRASCRAGLPARRSSRHDVITFHLRGRLSGRPRHSLASSSRSSMRRWSFSQAPSPWHRPFTVQEMRPAGGASANPEGRLWVADLRQTGQRRRLPYSMPFSEAEDAGLAAFASSALPEAAYSDGVAD